MPPRGKRKRNIKDARAPKSSPISAVRARAAAAHRSAEDLHKKSDPLDRRTERTHLAAIDLPKDARKPPGGGVAGTARPARQNEVRGVAPLTGRISSGAESHPRLPLTIVGIGASAGGFEAATQLLAHLPRDVGMAFVLVQHLDPTHESRLATLLAHHSALRIVEIRQPVRVEANCWYVLPSNASVTLEHGWLRLGPREQKPVPMPIDSFLRSLAREQQNRAIAVLLSGTGTDGTLGLEEIKGQGGLTIAQDKGTAKHFGMSGSAIAAGTVDLVLSPEQIAQEICRLAKHPYTAGEAPEVNPGQPVPAEAPQADSLFETSPDEIKTLFAYLRSRKAVDFSLYKRGTVNRRIQRRMALRKTDSLKAYVKMLQENPAELEALFHDLLINVTGFFRDAASFQALKKRLLPRLLKNRPPDMPIRMWSCGCSTGEEAYSLAIILTEFLEESGKYFPVQIFGSDLNERSIERARTGIYHENILLDVSPTRLKRFFRRSDGFYQVNKSLRDMCVFARHNLVTDPPFSNLDLISCRNVLIYLTPILQKRIMPVFHYALRQGGFLMLGSSETTGDAAEAFDLVDKRNKIYVKKDVAYRPTVNFERTFPAPPPPQAGRPRPATPLRPVQDMELTLQQKVDRVILSAFSPSGVVINAQMDVLQFRGRTGKYFEHQAGTASLNLLKLLKEELVLDVRRAVNRALHTNAPVKHRAAKLVLDKKRHPVQIEVHPLSVPPDPERFFLVLFEDLDPSAAAAAPESKRGGSKKAEAAEIRRLREELGATKESLQALIEEQDGTNEELKSANEEIQSSNEELQSTNEELETAREELQSTNEELTTLNQELQNRNTELAQINDDLTNLLSSVNIAIIMLGTDFKIRRFTPLAEKIFNLIPSDLGRKLSDLNRNLQMPDLDAQIRGVIDDLNVVEREVQDREGHWYSLRIRPYRTRESRIDGVVLMLFDIDDLKRSVGHIISLVRQPLLALTADLRISRTNEAFCRLFEIAPEDADNKSLYELAGGAWNIPRLRQLLEEYLPSQGEVRDFRLDYDFPNLGKRRFLLNARRFYEESRGLQLVLLSFEELAGEKAKG